MSCRLACGFALVLALAAPAASQEPPEKLLSPTTQLFVRWDGITAHEAAYKNSVWGGVMAGPTGDIARSLLAKGPKQLAAGLLADPLLEGKSPEELRAIHADLKHAEKALALVAEKGILFAAEVREPRPTLNGIAGAIGGLLGGKGPAPDAFIPEASAVLIVPDVGDRAETLFAVVRLLARQNDVPVEKLPPAAGRTGFAMATKGGEPVHAACWAEGPHFVLYVGTLRAEAAVKAMRDNAAKGGVTGHPLFQRCLKIEGFESVARGYADAASIIGLAKRLAGPFVPGLNERVEALGLAGLKGVAFSSGFRGKESRALYEFESNGDRKGLMGVLKPSPLTLNDLPPLPPDVSRFSSLRIDPAGAYDAVLTLAETMATAGGSNLGIEDAGKSPAEVQRLRKEAAAKELDKSLGLNVRQELLPHLGDKLVIFQSPTEGLNVFGTVVCISVKDAAKARSAVDRLQRGIETIVGGGPMKTKRKVFRGIEVREIYGRGFGVLTPTYAVAGDWLVIAGHPQPVTGLIQRQKGELARWTPDAATAARLAGMPSDTVGIQYCDPRGTAQNLCCIGPLFVAAFGRLRFNADNTEFDPVDIGLIPNGHDLARHLFPNLTYTRDDGKTLRIEVNESFSVPGEFIGLEPFAFAILTGLGI